MTFLDKSIKNNFRNSTINAGMETFIVTSQNYFIKNHSSSVISKSMKYNTYNAFSLTKQKTYIRTLVKQKVFHSMYNIKTTH